MYVPPKNLLRSQTLLKTEYILHDGKFRSHGLDIFWANLLLPQCVLFIFECVPRLIIYFSGLMDGDAEIFTPRLCATDMLWSKKPFLFCSRTLYLSYPNN